MIMDEESNLDFNFWPSFADLMLTLVLIMITVLFSFNAIFTLNRVKPEDIDPNNLSLKNIKSNQLKIIDAIAGEYNTKPVEFKPSYYGVSIGNNAAYDIVIRNDPTMQQLTFSDHILFESNSYLLNEAGKKALQSVGDALRQQIAAIQEIQIQGHADTEPTSHFSSNLELAAFRAIEVFQFLQEQCGIDPTRYLMSATSFGEYKPVSRTDDNMLYNMEQLKTDNDSELKKSQNRRIEMLLFYKN